MKNTLLNETTKSCRSSMLIPFRLQGRISMMLLERRLKSKWKHRDWEMIWLSIEAGEREVGRGRGKGKGGVIPRWKNSVCVLFSVYRWGILDGVNLLIDQAMITLLFPFHSTLTLVPFLLSQLQCFAFGFKLRVEEKKRGKGEGKGREEGFTDEKLEEKKELVD